MMKKILLALALASASSLFAVDNMGQWFNATPVDAETPVPWSLNGEDGSVITNLTDTAYWEIDADVTKAGTEEKTIFTPPSMTDLGLFANTITRVDISTTFDAMYDMTTEEGHPENFVGEDQPLAPPTGSLGALVVGSTTNVDESVASSNFYAYVGSTWKKLGTGDEVPHSLTGDVVHVRIELLYLYGFKKLRYSIGTVVGNVTNYVALADAAGETLFPFVTSGQNITGVEFSGCGKVHQVAAAVRNTAELDGKVGDGAGAVYHVKTADAFYELQQRGSGFASVGTVQLDGDFTLDSWSAIGGAGSAITYNFDGNGRTLTIKNLNGSFFGELGNCTVENLTIDATNAVDNTENAAIFATTCGDNVTFKNCTAAGVLHGSSGLAGFTLHANATAPGSTSVTFDNCTVTAELDNGTLDDPETEDENEKTYDNCSAFVAEASQGKVLATDGTTLATVNKYLAYGSVMDGQGTVPMAFNFYTNGVADNVNNIYYVEPQTVALDSTDPLVPYWVGNANAPALTFESAGKILLKLDATKYSYDIPVLDSESDFVLENSDFGELSWDTDVAQDGVQFVQIHCNPCVATVAYYQSEEGEEEYEYDEEELKARFGSLGVALQAAYDYVDENNDEETIRSRAHVSLCSDAQLDVEASVASGVTLDLNENKLTVNNRLGVAGTLISYAYDEEITDIDFGTSEDAAIVFSTSDDDGYNEDYYYYNEEEAPTAPTLMVDESDVWVGGDDATFATVARGPLTMTRVNSDHYDFLFGVNSDVTINAFTKGPNDTYTLKTGVEVKTAVTIEPATALAKLQAADTTKCIASASTEYAYTTADARVQIVGKKGFASLADALLFAEDEDVINLLGNVTLTSGATIDKAITLALGDYSLTIGDGSLTIDAAVTITKGSGSISGNIIVKAGENKSLTMDDVDPTTLTGVTFTGSENGATFIGDKTYTWNNGAWQGEQPVVNYVCQIVVSEAVTNKYETLQAAIDAATSGQTIQMIADASVEFDTAVCIDIVAGKSITLELNGKKLTGRGTLANDNDFIRVRYGAELTIRDTVSGGEIAYVCTNPDQNYGYGTYGIHNYGVLNLLSGKVSADCDNTGHGGITYAVANAVTTANQSAVFNMFGGELYLTKGDQSLYIVYNNVTDNSATNIVNITGGTITGKEGTSKGIFMGLNGGTPCMALNISDRAVVEGVLDVLRANDNCSINISGGDLDVSKLSVRNTCTNTKPFFNISSGTVKIDAYDVDETIATPIEITGGTFTNVAATDEKTKGFVPAVVCSITDNDPEAGKYTVTKESVPLTVTTGTGVASVTYTINGQPVDANPTVVYGDIVEITDVTYAYGYQAGTVKAGDKIEMTLEKLVTGEPAALVDSVVITVDAVERTFFGGGDGSEATPFIINVAQHLIDLKDYVAAGQPTAGKYFKQECDIDFNNIDGNGTVAPPWAGIGDLDGKGKCFNGIYDGNNKGISNVVFKAQKYGGFFNSMIGGLIKNLTIDAAGVEDFAGASDIGIGVFCGYLKKGGVIDGCTVTGFLGTETAPLTHNAAGFVNHYDGNCEKTTPDAGDPTAIKNSTSSIVIYTNKKGAGFAAHGGNSGSCYNDVVLFENCVFNGTINFCAGGEGANKSMAAQFMGYATNAKMHFVNCVAAGTIVLADGVASDADGALIGHWQDSAISAEGCIIKKDDKSIGKDNSGSTYAYTGFTYAVPSTDETYGDNYVELVAEDVFLAANDQKNYKVMCAAAPAIVLESGTWTFDGSLFDTFIETDVNASTDTSMNSLNKSVSEKVVTVTVSPLEKSDGVFEVVATRDSAGTTGNIKLTLDDAKKVSGYSDITSLAEITDVAAFQTALNADTDGVPLWQKLVLGLSGDQKPTVKATQDAATETVTFSLGTIKEVSDIRATGAKVKFYVDGLLGGELKEVGDTLTLPISSLFSDENKVERIKVKVVIDQANQKPQAANDNN